jgi:hypothetical protein
MDDSDLLAFTPVRLRTRVDGWTPRRQYFFILGLARGFAPARAAEILGMTRKTAYELRERPGSEGFARMAARGPSLAERALHGGWHPRLYRGRIVGWTRRSANARAMGLLKRLDKQVERLPPGTDAANLHACLDARRPERDSPDEESLVRRRPCHLPSDRQGPRA